MTKHIKTVSIVAIIAIILSFGILAIPNSFAIVNGNKFLELSGYEWLSAVKMIDGKNYLRANIHSARVSAAMIISFVFMLGSLALNGLVLKNRNRSINLLFTGIFTFVAGFIFLLTKLWAISIYPGKPVTIYWQAYVIGAVLLLIGLIQGYLSVLLIREEKKSYGANKSHEYSYLKKEENKK